MTDLLALAERIESATEGNRMLDGDVALAFGQVPPAFTTRGQPGWAVASFYANDGGLPDEWIAPLYTSDLGVVTDLVERLLPGYEFGIRNSGYAYICTPEEGVHHNKLKAQGPVASGRMARALLAALCRAMAEQAP